MGPLALFGMAIHSKLVSPLLDPMLLLPLPPLEPTLFLLLPDPALPPLPDPVPLPLWWPLQQSSCTGVDPAHKEASTPDLALGVCDISELVVNAPFKRVNVKG